MISTANIDYTVIFNIAVWYTTHGSQETTVDVCLI